MKRPVQWTPSQWVSQRKCAVLLSTCSHLIWRPAFASSHYQSSARVEYSLVGGSVGLVFVTRHACGLLLCVPAHSSDGRGPKVAAAFKGLQRVIQLRVQQLGIQPPVCSLHDAHASVMTMAVCMVPILQVSLASEQMCVRSRCRSLGAVILLEALCLLEDGFASVTPVLDAVGVAMTSPTWLAHRDSSAYLDQTVLANQSGPRCPTLALHGGAYGEHYSLHERS